MKHLKLTQKLYDSMTTLVLNDQKRKNVLFSVTYVVLGIVSMGMTIVNIFTKEYILMAMTLVFSLLCFVNYFLNISKNLNHKLIAKILFIIEVPVLLSMFIITGHPQGFSAIWAALLPLCGLLLFGPEIGSILSAGIFAILAFFFWIPIGKNMLQWEYSPTFMLRFPLLYVAFFSLSFVLSLLLSVTQKEYRHMYRHDPLTKALNRKGFTDSIQEYMIKPTFKYVGFIIGDLDHFKSVNDTYGHFAGDKVLTYAAKIISETTDNPICRWGGEEFAIFVKDGTEAQHIAETIRAKLDESDVTIDNKVFHQTISFGTVCVPLTKNITTDWLCKEADKCLYKAKESGRNQVVSHTINL